MNNKRLILIRLALLKLELGKTRDIPISTKVKKAAKRYGIFIS